MSYLQPGYCRWEDYRDGESSRLMADQLVTDELYFMMMALKALRKQPDAYLWPARVKEVTAADNGLHIVRFAFVNPKNMDEQPYRVSDSKEGYLTNINGPVVIGKQSVKNAYLSHYDNDFDGEFAKLVESIDLTADMFVNA